VNGHQLHALIRTRKNAHVSYGQGVTSISSEDLPANSFRGGQQRGRVVGLQQLCILANGAPRALADTSKAFRLIVSLEGGAPFEMPDLSKAPGLIGPITDLMTFYSDLFLAMHQGGLRKAGDHFYFPNPSTRRGPMAQSSCSAKTTSISISR
jgi:hypothetical protein